jgi:O-antigen ligase
MVKHADTVAFALAMPVLIFTCSSLWMAAACSAWALTAVMACDLVRLVWTLGAEILAKAHVYEPFIWVHSNIAAMLAGLAAIVLSHMAWAARDRAWMVATAVAGALVNVAYLIVIGSRGPQVAFVGALLVVAVLAAQGWRRRLAMAVVAAVVCMTLFGFRECINPRFKDVRSVAGLVDRDKVWFRTWDLIKERPLVGHGFGEKVFMLDYHTADAPFSPHRFYHQHQHALGMWFSFGAIGLVLVFALWGALAFRLLQVNLLTKDPSRRALTRMLLTLLVFIHIYALADCPTNATALALVWLVPAGLIATRQEEMV